MHIPCHVQIVSGLRSNKDPWNVLGVKPGATEHEIKQAHRHLVKQHHPDVKQGDVMAHAKFLSIQEVRFGFGLPRSHHPHIT
jgi:DnaJ-domain-containing protein 1